MARRSKAMEFVPEAPAAVLARMREITAAGDGWINFLPGVPGEVAEEQPRASMFSALFGNAQAPVSMCTWLPAKNAKAASIGIMHPPGRKTVAQLKELGAPVPTGWAVTQDHPRKGLVVRPAVGTADSDVLRWLLSAGEVLAMVPLTGTWKADIHLPRS